MALDVIPGEISVENGWTWQSCGDLTAKNEDWPVTVRRYEKAAKTYQRQQKQFDEGAARVYLGWYLTYQAPYNQAKQETVQGLKLLGELNPALKPEKMAGWKRYAYRTLGDIATLESTPTEAKKHYTTALESARIENSQGDIDTLTQKIAKLDPPPAISKEVAPETKPAPAAETVPPCPKRRQNQRVRKTWQRRWANCLAIKNRQFWAKEN